MEKVVSVVTSLDFFPKIPDDIKVRASSGGVGMGSPYLFLFYSVIRK
jgi:hypothetical protein